VIKPLFEVVDERELTDRDEELAFLWQLVVWLLSFVGFTAPADERLGELGLRHSDLRGFDRLADAVGYAHFPSRVAIPPERR